MTDLGLSFFPINTPRCTTWGCCARYLLAARAESEYAQRVFAVFMLQSLFNTEQLLEAGCDEAGRGCLAGAVFAAAVILPPDYQNEWLNDSKQLSAKKRQELRAIIERDALAWCVAQVDPEEIDRINILNAAILAMHRALDGLTLRPEYIIVDGNRFKPYHEPQKLEEKTENKVKNDTKKTDSVIPHTTIVKGDGKFLSIAAASILAKTYRDDYMVELHEQYPHYGWDRNAGYPTKQHRAGIAEYGTTPFHRMTFNLLGDKAQLELDFQ